MTTVDEKLEKWKNNAGTCKAKVEIRFHTLETARDTINNRITNLQNETRTEAYEKIMKGITDAHSSVIDLRQHPPE